MLFRSRSPTPIISYSSPSPASRHRRVSSRLLRLSLLLNAALLLAMLYSMHRSGPPEVAATPAAAGGQLLGGAGAAAAAAAGSGGKGAGVQTAPAAPPYWLTVGIPTVPRRLANTTYLTDTLETLLDELPGDPLDLLHSRVRVLVMNNAPGKHPEFEGLRERAEAAGAGGSRDRLASKLAAYVDFLDNPGTVADPAPGLPEPDDLNNPEDRPGRQVRKQTCDLVTLLRHTTPLSTYYLFMEDDFEVCPYALRALQYALTKANSLPHLHGWLALRVSYGMNGVLMRNEDLPALTDFLWRYITRKPPDLLWVEYLLRQPRGSTAHDAEQHPTDLDSKPLATNDRRPFVVYKYNLMSHLGAVSSFHVRPDRPAWPVCYTLMNKAWSLQSHERFMLRCRYSDLSPCLPRSHVSEGFEQWLRLPLDWAAGSGQLPPPAPPLYPRNRTTVRSLQRNASMQAQGSNPGDWPEWVKTLPILTGAKNAFESSKQMDEAVRATLASGESLYSLDIDTLQALRPDVVVTQSLCNVCSVNYCLVEQLTAGMDPRPRLVDLNPQNLKDVLEDMVRVGEALGLEEDARQKVRQLEERVAGAGALAEQASGGHRPKVGFLEWTDPLFVGGHWTPQLIEMAHASHTLNPTKGGGGAGKSFVVEPRALVDADVDWLIVCPCGFQIPQALHEMRTMVEEPWWSELRAVREGRVVVVDGDHMFNRPGPRLVEALEFLVGLLHGRPEAIPQGFPYVMWAPAAPAS